MLNRISCILSVAALIGLASCSKVVDQVPIPSRGPANLYGQFLLLDEFQDDDAPKAISPDSLHVSVTKNGGEQTDATFDAASSTYTFANLAPGTYALSYAYDGGQYETIVNPSFEHFGGDTAVRLPKAFLYRRSTTQVDSVKGLQKDVSKTIVYTQSVLVQPGDTLFVHKDSLLVINPNSSTPVTLLLEKDSTFRPTTLTEYNIRVRFTSIDRQLQFSVFLNQLSRDSMQRGYVGLLLYLAGCKQYQLPGAAGQHPQPRREEHRRSGQAPGFHRQRLPA